MKKLHYFSGVFITLFILLHLTNHLASLSGVEAHIHFMKQARKIYRNSLMEALLLAAVFMQIVSGIGLALKKRKQKNMFYQKLQIASGLYLAFFFIVHLGAIFFGRRVLHLDTNFYFGAAGLNAFPYNLFFIPYYSLAIICFFSHIASLHYQKMQAKSPSSSFAFQAKFIILLGFVVAFAAIFGTTNHFKGFLIPKEYKVLTGGK